MSAALLRALLCASAMLAPTLARAEEAAFVTQLRLPARGQSTDVFAWRDARGISVEARALASLGIDAPADARVHLSDVAGLAYVELESEGAIVLSCSPACFSAQRLAAREAPAAIAAAPWGGYLNYDLAADWLERGGASFGALMEANLFGPHGRGQASFIAHTETGLTRLDTSWTWDAPAARLRLRAGDAVLPMFGGGLAHFGGVQFGRHFALAPREITHPTPPLSGEAQSASTVELYIDGALSARARVNAGPFTLEDAPFVSGAGQAQLVVTDVLGREQIITRPFYVSSALLRPGLSDWSVSAGWARRGFGRESFAYGDGLAAAYYRRGVSAFFTAEAGAQWHEAGASAHLGAAFAHPLLGELSLAYAYGGDGDAAAFAWMREARAFAFGVQAEARDAGFVAPGREQGQAFNAAASLYLRLGEWGDVSVTAAGAAFESGPEARTYALSYSPDLRDIVLNIRLAYTERITRELELAVGLSVPLEGSVSASLAGQWDRRGGVYRASAQSPSPSAGGLGWRFGASGGAYERADAVLSYRGGAGDARAHAAFGERGAGLRLELTGAIGWIDEYAFAGRAIRGAFALVDAGAPNVTIMRDRLALGQSDARGRLLAADLRAYDVNIIAIDAEDLPLNRAPRVIHQSVSPREGAGLVVRFADTAARIEESVVRFADGAPAPRGAILIRTRDGARFPVGGAGRVVLQGWAEGDVLRLESDTRCAARAAPAGLVLACEGGA